MTLVKLSYFQKKIFSAVVQMYFEGSQNVLHALGPLIHDTCILIEYQTKAIADHCFAKVTWI